MDPIIFTLVLGALGIFVLYLVVKYAVKAAIKEAHAELEEAKEPEKDSGGKDQ